MPQGIGPVGIYHSHPFKSQIFHSHTDDKTLVSLSNQFPNCVSLVTNSEEINYYQMGKNSKTREISAEFIEPTIPKFLLLSMDETIEIKIENSLLNEAEEKGNLRIKILNVLRTYFEVIWEKLDFFYFDSKIIDIEIIYQYLKENLAEKAVAIVIPKKVKNKKQNSLKIGKVNDENSNILKLNLKLKIPIYVTDKKKFKDLNNAIRTEVISNNILQKIYNCIINYEENTILIPEDHYLNFFGFYIKILCFDKVELNSMEISRKIFEFISKILSLFESYEGLELPSKIKDQIILFLNDVEELARKFNWEVKITKYAKSIKDKLNLINN